MNDTLRTNNKIVRICSAAAIGLTGLLFVVLSAAAILGTSRIDPADPKAEKILFENDFVFANLGLIILTLLAALFFLRKKTSLSSVSTRFTVAVMLIAASIISAAWIYMVQSVANGEAAILLNTARDAARDQYGIFKSPYYGDHSYYRFFPFRLGYVLFAELFFRIFGSGSSDVLLQFPNVIAVDCIYLALVMLTKRLFDRRSVTNLTAIFLTVCLQPMFIATYNSGVLPGLAFSVWSVYHTVRYIKGSKWQHAAAAVALIAAAVLLDYKNTVILAAICIALLLHALNTFRLKDKQRAVTCAVSIGIAALMTVCSIGLQKGVIAIYSARSGTELNTSVSSKMNAYLGVSESGMAPGWYNGSAITVLRDSDLNMELAEKKAEEGINKRYQELAQSNRLIEFYKQKLLSQLNEPFFESVWVSQVRGHSISKEDILNPIVDSVYTGGLNKVLDRWFNYYNMMIYIFFAAGMAFLLIRKKLSPEFIILPAAVLGGIIHHMIYEAKSQFVLPYFILLIPFAAYGLIESIPALNKRLGFLYK